MSAVIEAVDPQLRLHCPAARYHASPGLNISRLKRLEYSPLHFQHVPAAKDVAVPMRLGQAAHCATLEPARFARDYVIWNRKSDKGNPCPRHGQYWEAFEAEHLALGHSIAMPDEYEHALCMQHAVRSDPVAARLLASGEAEVSMRWNMRGRLCKGRADWLTEIDGKPYIVGLKTAEDVRFHKFSNAAARYGYHLQWAWYHDGYECIRHGKPLMKEIVVESRPPYAVVVYDIPDEVIEVGRAKYEQLLDALWDCERAKLWPGPGMGAEVRFALPSWAVPETEENNLAAIGLEV